MRLNAHLFDSAVVGAFLAALAPAPSLAADPVFKQPITIVVGTPVALVWHETPFTTARDFFTHEVVVGASAPGSSNSVLPNLLNAIIGTRFRVVNGYPGSAGIELAMERGEVQAMVGDDLDMFRA